MKFKIKTTIALENANKEMLEQILNPENKTMKDGTVTSIVQDDTVITSIKGTMKIGTLLHTIDDILKTATLMEDIVDSTK